MSWNNDIPDIRDFNPGLLDLSRAHLLVSNYAIKKPSKGNKFEWFEMAVKHAVRKILIIENPEYILDFLDVSISDDMPISERIKDSGLPEDDFYTVIKEVADKYGYDAMFTCGSEIVMAGDERLLKILNEKCGDRFTYRLLNPHKTMDFYAQTIEEIRNNEYIDARDYHPCYMLGGPCLDS